MSSSLYSNMFSNIIFCRIQDLDLGAKRFRIQVRRKDLDMDRIHTTSVAVPYHIDKDPDPGSGKSRHYSGSRISYK